MKTYAIEVVLTILLPCNNILIDDLPFNMKQGKSCNSEGMLTSLLVESLPATYRMCPGYISRPCTMTPSPHNITIWPHDSQWF